MFGGCVCAQPLAPSARHRYFSLVSEQTQVGSSQADIPLRIGMMSVLAIYYSLKSSSRRLV
jgi:hypothetical protein